MPRVMQAKYYWNGHFFNSQLGYKPSYNWRSIQGAKMLKEGLIGRIGDGSKVSISKDKWIPKPMTYVVQTPPSMLPSTTKVQALIDFGTWRWNSNLVRAIFVDVDVDATLQIPLSMWNIDDKQIWQYTNSGTFSMKSANHLQKDVDGSKLWRIFYV